MEIRLGAEGQSRLHVVEQDEKTIKVRLYFQAEDMSWYKVVGRIDKDKLKPTNGR